MGDDARELPQPLEIGLRDNTAVADLPNGWQVLIVGWQGRPEPVVRLRAWEWRSEQKVEVAVPLGGTFQVGDETWRLMEMTSSDNVDVRIRIRRIGPGDPGGEPVNNVVEPAEMRPFGEIGWDRIAALNEQLPQPVLPGYQHWLRQNNGAQPVRPCRLPGQHYLLTPERPLLGLHPDYPPFDFLTAQRQWRDPYLPPDHFVIAVPGGAGGLLVTHFRLGVETINYLPPDAMTGRLDPEERATLLRPAAQGIERLLGKLEYYEPPAGPSAEEIVPETPRYWDRSMMFED
ncbi:DUF6406 domain-containing protein [Symbioplanes lichenis]|uniref:DUF6406 domain-containing protein n=1 Tax=Symbioplanes lichenis TaxID=1629072 RepID=UPI002739E9ED|nr:DUF6406 domain-containing protein [Actinoplanes lichenis]